VLALVLAVQSVRTYRYVVYQLVQADIERVATLQANQLQHRAFQARAFQPEQFQEVLAEFYDEEQKIFAWIRLLDAQGRVLAVAGEPAAPPPSPESFPQPTDREWRYAEFRRTPKGRVFVVVRPFRLRLGGRPVGPFPPLPPEGPSAGRVTGRQPNFLEMAIYPEPMGEQFQELRGQVVLSLLAALALLASLMVLRVRFESYVRTRQLEEQLELARRVQQDLLPADFSGCQLVDVAGACIPAWQVGGDFYDLFQADEGKLALVIGDVSGKGIPAALLMGLLHGAIRASKWIGQPGDLERATEALNELVRARTAVEHFVTMFWGYYDPQTQELCYVNAGHLPPLLLRNGGSGPLPEIDRLDAGGPVLGVIPQARYQAQRVRVHPGDTLVLYSDGLLEASNRRGEEFGEERLISALIRAFRSPPTEVCRAILAETRAFLDGEPLTDDLALLVVRFVPRPVPPEVSEIQMASVEV